jgi:uncharacterized protein YukE
MSNILITPTEVKRMSQEFEKHRTESEEQIRLLEAKIAEMVWDGVTKESFMARFDSAKANRNAYLELTANIMKILAAIAQRFEETDNAGRR